MVKYGILGNNRRSTEATRRHRLRIFNFPGIQVIAQERISSDWLGLRQCAAGFWDEVEGYAVSVA